MDALERYAILDTGREAVFDDVAALAADLLDAPMAVVNLIASDRQWFKAEVGIGTDSLPLDVSICRHAILQPGVTVVHDLRDDLRFRDNPLIHADRGLRFYAGALLETPEGLPLGTLCVLDRAPRPEGITPLQERALNVLASQIMAQIELRRAKDEAQGAGRRQSFLFTLEERLRDLGEPDEIMSAALALLGEHLGLDRVGYSEIIDGTIVRMTSCHVANGMAPLTGFFPLERFGEARIARQRQGITEVSDDVLADPEQDDEVWATIDTRAIISVPLVRDGQLRASLYVNSRTPRRWTPEEVALVEEVAARTWDAAERARAEADLRESEARLRLVQEAGGIGSFDYDLQKDEAICSPEYYAILGLPEGHPINRETWAAAIHPDDMHKALEALDRAIAERVPFDYEYRIVRADDERVRWLAGRAAILFDGEDRPWRYVGGNIDVTERKQAETALATKEQELQTLTDALPILVSYVDAERRYRFNNKIYETWFPRKREDIAGKPVREVLGEAAYANVAHHMDAALQGERVRFSQFMPYADTAGRHIEVEYIPRKAPDGSIEGFYTLVQDVSARMAAETALRETSRRLDAILANTREAVFLMDERQQCVFANAAAEKLTGYSFDQMKGRPLHDVVHHMKPDGSHYPLEECPIDRAFPERVQMSGEELFVAPDGSFYPVAFTASPVLNDDGEPIGTVIEARDISTEKAANERLAQLAAVSEQSLDFIGVADLQGRPVYVNEAGRAMVGLPSLEAACAVGLLDYFAPADRETILTQALRAAGGEGYWEGEVAFRRFDDGREFPVLYNIFPVRNAAGEITHHATVTRDLTEKKNVEAELRGLNATLEARVEERTRDLMAAEEALRQSQKMEAVGQLTGGLAHDFNNLLAGISGSLELMGTRITQGRLGEVERYMVAAQGAARRAAALTHRLLAFSRRQTLAPKVTDVNSLVIGMEDLIRRTVGPQVAVESALGGGLWSVLVDAPQLENALLNLAINARDAMPDGGKLTIETGNRWLDERAARARDLPPGQYVSLCVSDNGTGMTPDVIAQAFDPFFTTKPIGLGTGLGLSMVYGFARQSGGQVRIYSEVGQGTMVCLYLPRHLGEAEGAEADDTSVPGAAPAQAGETVLVIDDEPVVRMLIVDVLEELGYAALEASDGPEGLKVLQSQARLDMLISDVGLPGGLNGRQVADAARALRPDLKVLFITGYAENAVLNHGHLEHGMQVLTKPFAVEDLARRIRSILSEN